MSGAEPRTCHAVASVVRSPERGHDVSVRLYDYPASANCLKARMLLALLGRAYDRVDTDIFGGATLTDEFGALNPARETPVLVTADGEALAQSNAICWFLAEGTPYLPADPLGRARV